MSMTKRMLDQQNEQQSPAKCSDCKFNYDDKFFEYCQKHLEEFEADERERLAFIRLAIQG